MCRDEWATARRVEQGARWTRNTRQVLYKARNSRAQWSSQQPGTARTLRSAEGPILVHVIIIIVVAIEIVIATVVVDGCAHERK
jgi:hypothetical protein